MKKSTFAFLTLSVTAVAWSQPATTADVLRQSRLYQLQFRAGQYDVAPKFVAMLEAATTADPQNADLWNVMGVAHLAQAAQTMLTGGKPADAFTAVQQGMQSLERALALNPNHAEALAAHGGVQAMLGSFQPGGQAAAQGIAEMNRAVELAPNSVRVRLQRAFSGLSLPDALRNHAAEAEDLDFILKFAEGTRPGDYLHVMRGDLYFELSQFHAARNQYEIAGKSSSPAATDARARLASLTQGGVPAAQIKKLRSAAGANCVLCHGPTQ